MNIVRRSQRCLRVPERKLLSTGSLQGENCLFFDRKSFGEAATAENAPKENVAVILHGLLGSGRNLRGFSSQLFKQLSQKQNEPWTVMLFDLRNHGKSNGVAGLVGEDSISNAARDVIRTLEYADAAEPDVLIGHSMGGKVALEITKQLYEAEDARPPRHTWMLDSAPFKIDDVTSGTSADVLRVLETLRGIQLPVVSREYLYKFLAHKGFSESLQQWMGSNLIQNENGDGYVWGFNLEGVTAMFDSYLQSDYSSFLQHPPPRCSINVVRALKSNRWDEQTIHKLHELSIASKKNVEFGETHIHELPDAGHWLHAENPTGLIKLMMPHLLA